MENERLEPLETLENDYYLGERNGWYSDNEQRESESSDDELREQLSQLAGMRCKLRKGRKSRLVAEHKKVKKLDEFESDMDNELSENFVIHTSKMFFSPEKRNAENLEVGNENDMDIESSSSKTVQNEITLNSGDISSSSNKDSSKNKMKSVTFDDQLDKVNTEHSSTSFFNDNGKKNKPVEFYDSDEDEDNERWVRHHREQLKIVKSSNNASENDGSTKQKKEKDDDTDAVLSCPACMSLLTRDCQRHELYFNQYRAIFVENCRIVENEVLFLPQSRRNKRNRKCAPGMKPNVVVDPANVTTLPKEDLFYPVLCNICSTNVGVYDHDEVFHFFNVLTGYA